MKIAFAGTGYINKIHARAAQNLGLELEAVVNHKADSMIEFSRQFGITRQYADVATLLKEGKIDALADPAFHFRLNRKLHKVYRGLS